MHEDVLQSIAALLSTRHDVHGLAVIGSRAGGDAQTDAWSDIDLLMLVDGNALNAYLQGDWVLGFQPLYCAGRSNAPHYATLRAYSTDGRRVDCVIAPLSQWDTAQQWLPPMLRGGVRCLFSRTPAFEAALALQPPPPAPDGFSDAAFRDLVEGFRFKGMLAAGKVARNDLLVALHLTLDMFRDVCLLAMLLRDLETGRSHHRTGQGLAPLPQRLCPPILPTPQGILDSIVTASAAFEHLAIAWDPCHHDNSAPLLAQVARAQKETAASDNAEAAAQIENC